MTAKLRFAPLVRVSKEIQEKRGESLNIQTEKIKRWVAELNGEVVTWEYKAQEHSTPLSERKILDKLLIDATKGKFDAVIVDDISRWARDNLKSEQGLRHLKEHNIRFFVGSMEFDLHNPIHKFSLGQNVSMAELYAMVMAERNTAARIKKCKEGKGALAKLPHGRTYNKIKDQWGTDPEKEERFLRATEMFLAGSILEEITKETGLTPRVLYKLWSGAAGNTWTVHFKPKLFPKMAQDVTIKVPALLKPNILAAVQKKIARGKALYHGNRHRRQFLLNNVLFCGHCGYSMSGGAIGPKPLLYYIHPKKSGQRIIDCDKIKFAPAELIEQAVMAEIFQNFGDQKSRMKLLNMGGKDVLADLTAAMDRYTKELEKIEAGKERLVSAVEAGTLPANMIKTRYDKLAAMEESLRKRRQSTEDELSTIPTKAEKKGLEAALERSVEWDYLGTKGRYSKMSFEEKRELLRLLFGGSDKSEEKRKKGCVLPKFVKHGIYLKKTPKGWKFEIKGAFSSLADSVKKELKFSDPLLWNENC